MPQGRTHLAFELGTLPGWVALGVVLHAGRTSLVFFTGAYVMASLFLSPDLDLAKSDASRRWRRARFLWRPYAAFFRHRGISHSPLFGPLTRILYLAVLGAALWAILHMVVDVPFPQVVPWESALPVLAGLYLPHLLHVALDRTVSLGKRFILHRG
ncbi:MAG: DUF2227 family putative metal-binding protein [Candidatus Bipolaricaulota bacterium]|jgi:uncharacterized metal-binding protein